jgi:hypothetical protein
MVTATMEVMKNTRPKYKIAIIAPIATIGGARLRASRATSAVLLRDLVIGTTAQDDLVSNVARRRL